MKHIASKMIRALCGITTMLVLATGIAFIPANALDNGIYLAAATPHYQHPTTGIIEDSGGEKSKVLGQSMTESALHNEALVEVDPAGNTYITLRLNLMDNIEHPAFSVDTARNGSFTDVSSSVMQEDFTANTTDFRMQVANENVILRCAMYVVPMGRDVVFYITVSDLKQGSGNFVSSVEVASHAPEPSAAEISQTPEQPSSEPSQAAAQPQTSAAPAPSTVSKVQSAAPESSVSSEASKQSKPGKTSEPSQNSEVSQKSEPTESSAASKAEETTSAVSEPSEQSSQAENSEILQSSDSTETVGLTEFDAQGSKVKETSDNTNAADGSNAAIWVIIGIMAVAAVGIIVFIILKKGKGAK